MNAEQILEQKGYDADERMNILSADVNNNLDMKVREEFGLGDQPLHLWDGYYLGDADEEKVMRVAKSHGYADIDTLFRVMDNRLRQLADEYPAKS